MTETIIPLLSEEQVLKYINAVEVLNPKRYTTEIKNKNLIQLIKFKITSQKEAQINLNSNRPYLFACGCMGGPEGCSFCNCELVHSAYDYRYHLYLYYFYPNHFNLNIDDNVTKKETSMTTILVKDENNCLVEYKVNSNYEQVKEQIDNLLSTFVYEAVEKQ